MSLEPVVQEKINRTRRAMLTGIGCSIAACIRPSAAFALGSEPRRLSFYHTHTRASLDLVYHDGLGYLPDALDLIASFLRDFRTGDVHPIEPGLLDIMFATSAALGSERRFEVISGYRSPATNEMLRHTTDGVAKASLHMQGRAIDVRLTGTRTDLLRRAAIALARGGVGYYPRSDFIHLDTGRPRSW